MNTGKVLGTYAVLALLVFSATDALAGEPGAASAHALVDKWLETQNKGLFGDYEALYTEDFTGIRRSNYGVEKHLDRKGWMEDRRPMFKRGQTVTITALDIRPFEGSDWGRVVVRFRQYWQAPTYADQGVKTLALAWTGSSYQIRGEELHDSSKWDRKVTDDTSLVSPEEPVPPPIRSSSEAPGRSPGSGGSSGVWDSPGLWAVAGLALVVGWSVYKGVTRDTGGSASDYSGGSEVQRVRIAARHSGAILWDWIDRTSLDKDSIVITVDGRSVPFDLNGIASATFVIEVPKNTYPKVCISFVEGGRHRGGCGKVAQVVSSQLSIEVE